MTTQLIIERGSKKGTRIEISNFPATVGRDGSNTISIDDEESSRFHFRIKKRGRLYIIEDLESKNGTYINGDKILNSILHSGDKILIGGTEFHFVTSAPNIQLAQEILNFDMVIAENLGLAGPIDIANQSDEQHFRPIRLNPMTAVDDSSQNLRDTKKIYDLHSNILVIDDLEEAANSLLKSIGQIAPSASRAALFVWAEGTRQLLPIAARHFTKLEKPFLLSQKALEDTIARRQSIILKADNPQSTHGGSTGRFIAPIVQNGKVICIVHIESDHKAKDLSRHEIDMIQALIKHCTPSMDSLLLRKEIDSWMVGMVETVIATIEAKDTYTLGHSERVCRYSMAIADELKLNRETKKLLMISSLCHDIGKIGIPDSILKKASLLSADEYEEMKLHPTIGADIISNMPNAHRFMSGVKYHHEKWDGTGYPEGLVGEEIPFFGRIVAVADVFDAMISGRSYSGFIDESFAVEKIQKEKDLFDPEIIKALVKAWDSGSLTQKTSTQSQSKREGKLGAETASHPAAKEQKPKSKKKKSKKN